MNAQAVITTANMTKALFVALAALSLTAYKWPKNVDVQDEAEYDYVVVGAGTGGSLVAHRLSEDPHVRVLLIDAGDDPRWETQYVGFFPYAPKTQMDFNYTAEDDSYTAQNHRNKYLDLPTGKVLGGTSTLLHFFYLRGHPCDYDLWVKATGDKSWSWWNLLPYFKKHERLEDQEILNSPTSYFHGSEGLVGLTRETRESTFKYLEAFKEIGNRINKDQNTDDTIGFGRPLYYIDEDGIRQNSAECFLATAKQRSNLHLMRKTLVRKVLFDKNLNAIGVECSTPDGNIINIYARREIVVAAGTLNTPKVLQLSGIGPKKHLKSLGIPVIHDSPVGKNFQDHVAVILVHTTEQTDDTPPPANPSEVPSPTFVGISALNESQSCPDYLTLNFIIRNNPSALLQFTSVFFGLNDDVANQIAEAGTGREVVLTILNMARPKSTGSVMARSSNPEDPPKIYTGFYSNDTDLENTAKYIQQFIKVTRSTYFKSVGGETVHFDLPRCNNLDRNTTEYWKCYILNMMDSTFFYSSTCAMGTVLDSRLRVKGVKRLRVGDSSAGPNQVTGSIITTSMVIAEKLADMMKEDNHKHYEPNWPWRPFVQIYDYIKERVSSF